MASPIAEEYSDLSISPKLLRPHTSHKRRPQPKLPDLISHAGGFEGTHGGSGGSGSLSIPSSSSHRLHSSSDDGPSDALIRGGGPRTCGRASFWAIMAASFGLRGDVRVIGPHSQQRAGSRQQELNIDMEGARTLNWTRPRTHRRLQVLCVSCLASSWPTGCCLVNILHVQQETSSQRVVVSR